MAILEEVKDGHPETDRFYTVPIKYNGNIVGEASFYKDRLPKDPNFKFLIDARCTGNFDKNIVKEYEILGLTIIGGTIEKD